VFLPQSHISPVSCHGSCSYVYSQDVGCLQTTTPVTANHLEHIPVHLRDYPLNESDARIAQSQGLVVNLRKVYDALVNERNRKQRVLKEIQDDISERILQDDFTLSCIQNGEDTMKDLCKKVEETQMKLEEAARLTNFYTKLESTCEENKMTDETWLEILEKRMQASELQCRVYIYKLL
jgi:hypothetical protein